MAKKDRHVYPTKSICRGWGEVPLRSVGIRNPASGGRLTVLWREGMVSRSVGNGTKSSEKRAAPRGKIAGKKRGKGVRGNILGGT